MKWIKFNGPLPKRLLGRLIVLIQLGKGDRIEDNELFIIENVQELSTAQQHFTHYCILPEIK